MTTATATRRRLDPSGVERATWTGWGGVAVGIIAWWIALPPLLIRSPIPSVILALVAIGLGVANVALAGLQLVGGALGVGGNDAMAALVRPAAVVQAVLCALAFGALLLLFARSDMSVALVANHSHSAKPML